MRRKSWTLALHNKDVAAELSENLGLDPLAALLASSRGIKSTKEANDFFKTDGELYDPLLMKDMDKAVMCIRTSIGAGEKITIYGDYDADGVTASTILCSYLQAIGASVTTLIPDRHEDGYGLNSRVIEQMKKDDTRLIITVDNGISAIEEAKLIAENDMKLIVTDHHMPGDELPEAVAVINPHRKDCTYPFKDLAGVGVAFKLICAIEGGSEELLLEEYSDLAAIGTVADIVPLVSENRLLVQHGLKRLQNSERVGIRSLLSKAGRENDTVRSSTIAFTLAPRINALGRIETASKAVELLLTDDEETANALAEEIQTVNTYRQGLEQKILKEIEEYLTKNPEKEYERVLVLAGLDWHIGVIGIVASRIVERFGRPCIILSTDPATGETRGSGRSVAGFSLYDAIDSCKEQLVKYGGHPMAAGVTLEKENIDKFIKGIQTYAKSVEMPFLSLNIDCRIRPSALGIEMLDIIEVLEPFGAGNPRPVFGLYKMNITNVQPLSEGKHTKLILSRDGLSFPVLRFNVSPQLLGYNVGDVVDVAVTVEPNVFRGELQLSIKLADIRPSDENPEDYFKAIRIYDAFRRGDTLTTREKEIALPTRLAFVKLFRFLEADTRWTGNVHLLYLRLQCDECNPCSTRIALDVFLELGVLVQKENTISLGNGEKVQLEKSEILQKLS